jgi:hypothetical protein
MSSVEDIEREQQQEIQAAPAPARRSADSWKGLRNSRSLRSVFAIGWSAFLGTSLSLLVLLMMPEGWLDSPLRPSRLGFAFALLWVLALVPATFAALLCGRRQPARFDDHAR